jgi:hypothetical protein
VRKLIAGLVLAAALLFTPTVKAQRFTVGIAGGDSFDNYSLGVQAGIEIPFLKHYELDLKDTFSPVEAHVSLGSGRANKAEVGGIVWLSDSFGLTGKVEDSSYNVTKVGKDADYAFGGLAYRTVIGGLPTRLSLQYIQQFNNGISATGLETSHLKGADLGFTVRYGCTGRVCIRSTEDFTFGRVLTQGNPQCDGTYGIINGPNGGPCYRTPAFGGGFTGSVVFEFPRPRGHEYEKF